MASTEHGICSVKVGRNDAALIRSLRTEFPRAEFHRGKRASNFLEALNDYLGGQQVRLPVDVK